MEFPPQYTTGRVSNPVNGLSTASDEQVIIETKRIIRVTVFKELPFKEPSAGLLARLGVHVLLKRCVFSIT
jgi:hypothetical protein